MKTLTHNPLSIALVFCLLMTATVAAQSPFHDVVENLIDSCGYRGSMRFSITYKWSPFRGATQYGVRINDGGLERIGDISYTVPDAQRNQTYKCTVVIFIGEQRSTNSKSIVADVTDCIPAVPPIPIPISLLPPPFERTDSRPDTFHRGDSLRLSYVFHNTTKDTLESVLVEAYLSQDTLGIRRYIGDRQLGDIAPDGVKRDTFLYLLKNNDLFLQSEKLYFFLKYTDKGKEIFGRKTLIIKL